MTKYNVETVAEIVKAQTDNKGSVNTVKVVEKIGQFFPQAVQFFSEKDLSGKDESSVTAYLSAVVEEVFKKF